ASSLRSLSSPEPASGSNGSTGWPAGCAADCPWVSGSILILAAVDPPARPAVTSTIKRLGRATDTTSALSGAKRVPLTTSGPVMNVLFVHNNFPAQYRQIARALADQTGNRVVAVGSSTAKAAPDIRLLKYSTTKADSAVVHPFARRFDVESRRAEEVLYALSS